MVNVWDPMQQDLSNLLSVCVSSDSCYFLQVMCFLMKFSISFQMKKLIQLWELSTQTITS